MVKSDSTAGSRARQAQWNPWPHAGHGPRVQNNPRLLGGEVTPDAERRRSGSYARGPQAFNSRDKLAKACWACSMPPRRAASDLAATRCEKGTTSSEATTAPRILPALLRKVLTCADATFT